MNSTIQTPSETISPDELLFELYHLLPLAFAMSMSSATLRIGPTDDGKDACLVDLQITADKEAIKRPDFGYNDASILDQLNNCLVALLHSIAERTGDLLTKGTLHFNTPDSDESIWVELKDTSGEIILTRRIDKSERYTFIHHENLYKALLDSEKEAISFAEKRSTELTNAKKYTLDIDQQLIHYTFEDGTKKSYRMAFLASHHEESQNFIWAWANDAIPEELRYAIKRFQSKQTTFGLSAFSHPEHFFPSLMAEKLCAFATGHIRADFFTRENYLQGDQKLSLYLALWTIDN